MTVFRYSRTRYFPDGSRTIEVEIDNIPQLELPELAADGAKRAMEAISEAEKEEKRLSEERVQKQVRALLESPETRLESLKYQKLKLEDAVREISAEIMKTEEAMEDRK